MGVAGHIQTGLMLYITTQFVFIWVINREFNLFVGQNIQG